MAIIRSQVPTRYLILGLLLLSTYLGVELDIPLLRPLLGFVFVTFTPGTLLLEIGRENRLQLSERVVFAMGLSVVFILAFGLFVNQVYPLLGVAMPLSAQVLQPSFLGVVVVMGGLAFLRNRSWTLDVSIARALGYREKRLIFLFATLPFLSVLGVHTMNVTGSNGILIVMLSLACACLILGTLPHEMAVERLYPWMVLCLAAAVVFVWALRSNHLLGADIHTEYYVFRQTLDQGRWQLLLNSNLDSCLSISVLPVVYYSFLNVEPEMLFKTLYASLLAGAPLAVYVLSRQVLTARYAYLAAMFFVAQPLFTWGASGPRTSLAVLLFSISLMAMYSDRCSVMGQRLWPIALSIGCIFSHYTTSYIFLFALGLAWLIHKAMPRRIQLRSLDIDAVRVDGASPVHRRVAVSPSAPLRVSRRRAPVTGATLAILGLGIFMWHGLVIQTPFAGGVGVISRSIGRLAEFAAVEARGEVVAEAFELGFDGRSAPQIVDWLSSWLTVVLIGVGVVTAVVRLLHAHRPARPERKLRRSPEILHLNADLIWLALACSVLLAAQVVLPYVSVSYGFGRSMLQTSVVLAPFFVWGGLRLAGFPTRSLGVLPAVAVLVTFFMSSTGLTYALAGVPNVVTLSSEGERYDELFLHSEESQSAVWIRFHTAPDMPVYGDWFARRILLSQGGMRSGVYDQTLIEADGPSIEGLFFVRHANLTTGRLMARGRVWYGPYEHDTGFVGRSQVYANRSSQVWGPGLDSLPWG